jgi:WS/DGAT/MGAT family acyltransferase
MKQLERLSFLDASFLALESPVTHMHVGSVAIFESSGDEMNIDRFRQFISSRLHLVNRYRQKLAWIPVEKYPVWIDDEDFNLDFHVRHTSLPPPGTDQQLRDLAGRLMAQQLDRTKPLWEFWLVDGLPGNRFALISKIHHSMIDGISSVDLMAVMYGFVPESDPGQPQPWHPAPTPTGAELAAGDFGRRLRATLDRVRNRPERTEEVVSDLVHKASAVGASLTSGWLRKGAPTPLNQPIGPNRRFSWTTMALDDVKAVKNNLGGSLNDVVLTTVAGAVRSFLQDHRDTDVADVEYRIMAPVSVRPTNQRGNLGNQVAMWLVDLPISDPDPRSRYEKVAATTQKLKSTDQALGASTIVQMSSGTPGTLLSLGARLAAGRRPFAATVTNVPGPQFPVFMLDAQMVHQYPLVPLWQNQAYGLALFSYNGELSWGVNGEWDLLPDIEDFVGCIESAFNELGALGSA